jgi:hypothetical protein
MGRTIKLLLTFLGRPDSEVGLLGYNRAANDDDDDGSATVIIIDAMVAIKLGDNSREVMEVMIVMATSMEGMLMEMGAGRNH